MSVRSKFVTAAALLAVGVTSFYFASRAERRAAAAPVDGGREPAQEASASHPATAPDVATAPTSSPAPKLPVPVRAPRAAVVNFGEFSPLTIADVPAGRFRERLEKLSPAARQRALTKLAALRVPLHDVGSLDVENDGALFYQCIVPSEQAAPAPIDPAVLEERNYATVAISALPPLHSRPGATKVIYLDFTGHTISGTAWNEARGNVGETGYRPAVTQYVAKPFDTNGDPTTFDESEQYAIQMIWSRVADDYVAFDVDVTTEEPAAFTSTTGRVLITAHTDANGVAMPSSTSAGVAYLGVFGETNYASYRSPALVYFTQLSSDASRISEVASHEMGHNLSLSHDGNATQEYYEGHGSYTAYSWAPIMGSPYNREFTQWSKGEYYGANNLQDDIAILSGHLGAARDDAGDSESGTVAIESGPRNFLHDAVIGASDDTDRFSFSIQDTTAIALYANPIRTAGVVNGPNVNLHFEVYDARGNVLGRTDQTTNSIYKTVSLGLAPGTYTLRVSGVGQGTPTDNPPSGFTRYGSIGGYTIAGIESDVIAPTISTQPGNASVQAGQMASFRVYTDGNPAPTFQWQRQPSGSSTWHSLSEGDPYRGVTTSSLSISTTLPMNGDAFRVVVTNIGGSVTSNPVPLAVSPPIPPQVYGLPPTVAVAVGEALQLNPSTAGTSPFTVVWRKDGVVLPDAPNMGYYKFPVTAADAGLYAVTLTNLAGSATSATVTVLVTPAIPPQIYNLASNVVVRYGNELYLNPNVSGTSPMSFQWKRNGEVIPGATNRSYSRNNITTAEAGLYTLTATNAVGSAVSSAANVIVSAPLAPTIVVSPTTYSVATGESVNISPSVAGTSPMTMTWKKDGLVVSSSDSSLYLWNTTTANSGTYTLTVTNAFGTAVSPPITVVVRQPTAPRITGLPASFSAQHGQSVGFYPSVSGTSPVTLQWLKDNVVLPDYRSSYFSFTATAETAGTYTLRATNAAGTTEQSVVLTVAAPVAPVIFGLPAKLVVGYGESLYLNPTVRGTNPMTFRWEKDRALLSGATSSYYSKNRIGPADAGSYVLTATNVAGSTQASPVLVEVLPAVPPLLVDVPTSLTFSHGDSFSLSIGLVGTLPMTYSLSKDGVEITAGETTGSSFNYYKSSATAVDSGAYVLTVTNVAGTATSSTINIVVGAPVAPEISNMPATLTVNPGQSWQLSPSIRGTSPLTYVWRKDGVILVGQASASLYRSTATAADAGTYTLTATNVAGSATSTAAVVTVNAALAPVIYSYPQSVTAEYGGSAALTASVTGTTPITYVWKKDGVEVSSSTSTPTMSLSSVTNVHAGSYTLTATNSAGSATSPEITLIVGAPRPPAIVSVPGTVVLNYGYSLDLRPEITGTSPMTFQWKKDGINLPGQTSQRFSKSSVTGSDAGSYVVTATNAWGTATSTAITVVVNAGTAPAIYHMPQSTTRSYGEYVSYYPTVIGTTPMTYQWYRGDAPITGMTGSSFYISSLTPEHSGSYRLVVTNEFGTTTSESFTLTVLDAVLATFTRQPESLTAALGATARFAVECTGSSPLNYRWFFNGVAIAGATSTSFERTVVQATHAGRYHVEVTTPAGTVTSQTATLTIDPGLPVVEVAAGTSHSLILRTDGSVWATGDGSTGQLADGSTRGTANFLPVATGVARIAAGSRTTFLLKLDGTLWGAGDNRDGAVGVPFVGSVLTPMQIASDVAQVSARSRHTLLIKTDGSLWAFGVNNEGQLGDGTKTTRRSPIQVDTSVAFAAVGGSHCLYLKTDGTLWAMGNNSSGQLGDGTTTSRLSPVQIATDVVAAAAGADHSLFVKRDGTLWGMGSNSSGQLGDGTTTLRLTPVLIEAEVTQIEAGSSNSFFVTTEGTLWGMGSGSYGQLGNGGSSSLDPVQIARDVVAVRASLNYHALYLAGDGSLWGMGYGYSGQLGYGGSEAIYTPRKIISAVPTVPQIVVPPASQGALYGGPVTFTVGLLGRDNYTFQWTKDGVAIEGATGRTLTIPNFAATDRGDYAVVVTNAAGSATSTPASLALAQLPVITAPPQSRTAATGDSVEFTVAVTSNAPVTYQWKRNGVALLGATGATFTLHSVSFADDGTYTVTVTNAAGSVVSAGAELDVRVPPIVFVQPRDTSAVDGGPPARFYFLAYGGDETTYAWQRRASPSDPWIDIGNGTQYAGATTPVLQLLRPLSGFNGHQFRCIASVPFASVTSDPATLTVGAPGHLKIAAGRYHSARLDVMGGVTTAGANAFGQLGTGDNTAAAAARTVTIPGKALVDLAAGGQHTLLLTSDRELYAVGANATGQLGDGTLIEKSTPVKIASDVVAFSAGLFHSAYIKSDGTLWTVGGNDSAQLGDGTTVNKSVAQQIATGVVDVSVGVRQTWFLKADGSAWAVGNLLGAESYSVTPTQIETDVVRLAAGGYHALLLKTNGQLYGYGYNANGQLGDYTTTTRSSPVLIASGVASISAGYFHSAYIKEDGTLWAMGANGSGQLGDGTTTARSGPQEIATNVASVSAGESHTLFTKSDGTLWAMGSNSEGAFGHDSTTSSLVPVKVAGGVLIAPENITGVAVNPGTNENYVLNWTPSPRATAYEIWTSNSFDPNTAERVAGNLRWPYYEDRAPLSLARFYWVVAVNSAGRSEMIESVSVSTQVVLAPAITSISPSLTTPAGASISLTVEASGTLPLAYQWLRNGKPLPDETSTTLTINPATSEHTGNYTVQVRNLAGLVTSDPVTLTVEKLAQTIDFVMTPSQAFTSVPLMLSATASSGLPVSFELMQGSATLTGANLLCHGAGLVMIRAVQPGNSIYAAESIVIGFTVASGRESWSSTHFTAEERANAAISGPNADPDGDGLSNLLEYALGLEPRAATTSPLLEVAATASEWTYTYTRPGDRGDVVYMVEISTNLTTWSSDAVTHELVSTDAATGAQTWRARVPLSTGANLFFRLRVSVP